MGMIDVGEKKVVKRRATAAGNIRLSSGTLKKVREGEIRKGDPLLVAEVAAMNAAKQTHILIPHCHQIPLDMVKVTFTLEPEGIEARCVVSCRPAQGLKWKPWSVFPWRSYHLGHGEIFGKG